MKWLSRKIQQYLSLRTQRLQLLAMDESMRKDLAISRTDAERYAGRYKPDKSSKQDGGNAHGRDQLDPV